jgi:hypothetical protein
MTIRREDARFEARARGSSAATTTAVVVTVAPPSAITVA